MDLRITGLAADTFRPLFGLPDEALARRGAKRYVAHVSPGFPDRVELRDAEPGCYAARIERAGDVAAA
jgi:hypothetical protein